MGDVKSNHSERAMEVLERSILETIGEGLAAGVADDSIPDWVGERIRDVNERAEQKLADELLASLSQELAADAKARIEFADLHRWFWGRALDLFWLVRVQNAKLGSWLNDLPPADGKRQLDAVASVMRDVQGRACRVAAEVHALLSAGLREGAEARSRTLYELDVVTSVIVQADDPEDAAQRYLAHAEWEGLQDLHAWIEAGRGNEGDLQDLRLLEARVGAHVERFGRGFAQPGGWAASLVDGRPTFKSLEALAGHVEARCFYTKMCHSVHGGSAGTAQGIVDTPEGPTLVTGQEEELPTDAAAGALLALCRVTFRLAEVRSDACGQAGMHVWLGAIEHLRDEATREFEARREELKGLLRPVQGA